MKKRSIEKILLIVFLGISLSVVGSPQKTEDPGVMLRSAIEKEEVDGDLQGAIELYKEIIAKFGENQAVAALAQLRIGMSYEKLGSKTIQLALEAFQKVLDNYPDQTEAVEQAREKLSILQRARAIIEKEDQGIKMTKIPYDPEKVAYSFISPDAKKMANVSPDYDIWISDIATGKEFQLTTTEARENWCVWSPDSQLIALLDGPRNLYVVSAQGGTPKMLIENDEEFKKETLLCLPRSWSSDSQKIYCWIVKKGLFAVPIDGGEWEAVYEYTRPDQYKSEYALSLSPNEKFIAYHQDSRDSDIYIRPVKGGEPVRITHHPARDGVLMWSYDGRWLLFSSARNGPSEPWIIGISPEGKREGEPFQIPFMRDANLNLLRWAKDGKIGMTHYWNTSHLFIANADGSDEVQITKRDWAYWLPKWSPDNKYIAFGGSQVTTGAIYIMPVQGGELKNISEILKARAGAWNYSDLVWHPNGRSISIVVDGGDDRGMWTVDIENGLAQKKPFDYAGYIGGMDWSPDGKQIVFDYIAIGDPNEINDSEFNCRNIYVMPAEGGEPVRMTRVKEESFYRPLWSPDGRRIAFTDSAGRIWIADPDGGEPQPITDKKDGIVNSIISWSPDGENIIFSTVEGQQSVYYSVSFKGGELRKIDLDGLNELDFSSDGKKIVYYKPIKQVREFWLLENFLPERKSGK